MIVLLGDTTEGLLIDTVECVLGSKGEDKIVRVRNVESKDVYTASYVIERLALYVPPTTVFLAVVDAFNESARVPIALLSKDEKFFVGFDNGIFTAVAERFGIRQIRKISGKMSLEFSKLVLETLTPAALNLARGVDFSTIGELYMTYYSLKYHRVSVSPHSIEGEVAFFDNENVETNIPFSLLEKIGIDIGDEVVIHGRRVLVSDDERQKENRPLVLRKGLGGYVEFVSKDSARRLLKVNLGEKIVLEVRK